MAVARRACATPPARERAHAQQFLGFFDRMHKYNELIRTVEGLRAGFGISDPVSIMRLLNRHRREYKIISTLDFFPSESRERAARALAEAEMTFDLLYEAYFEAPGKA